jgi:hypothetical protein
MQPAASASLSKGLGRRISAHRRPALARQAGSPVTVPGGGARMPTASGLPVARRDAALVQARRAATSTSSSLCCDDDQHAVGERPLGRSGSRRLTAGEVRNSFMLSRRRERTPPPGLRGPRCPPAARASAAGAAGLRARPGSGVISSSRVLAGPRRGGCLPAQDRGGMGRALSVLRRVPVDRRRERALFEDVGVHACLPR